MEPKDLCELSDSKGSSNVSIQCHSSENDIAADLDKDTENDLEVSQSEDQHVDQDSENSRSCSPVDNSTHHNKDGSQNVIWTISVAMAIPKGEDEEPVIAIEKPKKKLKRVLSSGVVEAPKAQGYYHIEYNLLPDDPEPIKVDLVMFGLAAKIYMDNETKVLKPWHEGDQVWLGWSQSVKVKVTRELLIKFLTHKITFRVWDTKDRVSAKARYDRPKAFRLPQAKNGEEPDHIGSTLDCDAARYGGIKQMVYKLRNVFEKENPRTRSSAKRRGDIISMDFKKFSELNCATGDPKASTTEVAASEKVPSSTALNAGSVFSDAEQQCGRKRSVIGVDQDLLSVESKSTKPEGAQEQEKEGGQCKPTQKKSALDQSLKASKVLSKTAIPPMKSSSVKDKNLVVFKKKALKKPVVDNAAHMENIRKNGVASVELSLIYLLAGDRSLTDCLVTCAPGVYEGMCNITLDKPLISEQLKVELNPLVITVLSASSMPSSPVPFNVLEEKCLPVYCQYKFHNLNMHKTKCQEHSTNVYFKDVNVILTGLLKPGELLEFVQGPPLEIEVHDRDRKVENPSNKPALFGTEPNDDKLSNVILVSGKRTTHNPLRKKTKMYNPYGVAKLNLSELLQGHRCLKVTLPIKCCPPPQLLGSERTEWERRMMAMPGTVDDTTDQPMPMGHYVDANSQLKVQMEIACPLNMERSSEGADCPFGRIIYIFKYNNLSVMAKLRSEILKINAEAFELNSQSIETIERALSSYKMTAKERGSVDLDTVTGFHMLDKQIHLFVLEGLQHKAIKKLWETVPIKLMGSEEEQVRILYNSNLNFSKRLYDTLKVDLSPIHLYEPLETIMRQPLVYVRDMVPHTCFQAISRLSVLCKLRKLKDVVQSNLFPSAEMVLSMSKEFGIVPGKWEQRLMATTQHEPEISPLHASENTRRPLSTYNTQYIQWKKDMAKQQSLKQPNYFIQANIEEVEQASHLLQKPKAAVIVAEPAEDSAAHNYSIQTKNSTEQAKELLRREMIKEPSRRFTYSQQHHTATVDPTDVESERRASEARSRSAWRTYDGFIYPGFKSSIESNEHPKHPTEARVEELRKPWRENVLHGNTLRPTLERDRWPWSQRFQDFELYLQPPHVFSPVTPVTIHLAGERLQQEQQQTAWFHYSRWLRRLLPGGSTTARRTVPEFRCHMGGADPGKLQDMLKDQPMKYSLRKPGMALKPIPVLSVVQRPLLSDPEQMEKETSIAFAPGPFQNQRLSLDYNTIPRHNSQYNKYHFEEFWRQPSPQYKRAITCLTEEERKVHVFQKPASSSRTQTRAVQSQPARNIVETRTYKNITLHVH